VRFRTKDGRIVHLLIDSNVAYNKDGSFGHTRCFIRDDTARKVRDARTKLLLEETERVRGWMGGGRVFADVRSLISCVFRVHRYSLLFSLTQSLRMLDGFLCE
jgi:hypothetical protein